MSSIRFIEVKSRTLGAQRVTVSRNEILTALNEPERFVLALVEVRPDGSYEVRYVRHPYRGDDGSLFGVTSVKLRPGRAVDTRKAPA